MQHLHNGRERSLGYDRDNVIGFAVKVVKFDRIQGQRVSLVWDTRC